MTAIRPCIILLTLTFFYPRTPPMDLQHINRLPPELLVEIATLITDQSTIFRLATVCRCWHDALTGTTTLWTSIDCRSESRTSILLERSKSSPIDVTVDLAHFVPEAVSLIANHTHRMRSIDVALSARRFGDVRSLLNGLAPILETMRMEGRWEEEDLSGSPRPFPAYSSLFQGQFPALRALHLKEYPLDLARSTSVMTNCLTTLDLNDRRHYYLHDLLEHLENYHNLVRLRISLSNLQETIPASRIVSLPKLRELRLAWLPFVFLQHLSFPPSTNLNIRSRSRDHAGGYSLADVWARDGLPQALESRAVNGIKMVFCKSSSIIVLSGSHSTLVEHIYDSSRSSSFRSDCLDSFQSLPIATTQSLKFTQPPQCPFTGSFRPQSCTRLLLQMPELQQITLDSSIAPYFIRALEPVDRDIPCPRLGVLIVIRRVGHEVGLQDSLLALSNQRKDHGCPLVCGMGSPGSSVWQEITHLERDL